MRSSTTVCEDKTQMEDCTKKPCQIRLNMHKIPVNYMIKVKNRFSAIVDNLTHANIDEIWKATQNIVM